MYISNSSENLSLVRSTSSGAVISGTPDAVGSNTTSNFTIRAKDAASNISDRAFSATVNAPVISSYTSSGTFSVPSGLSSVNVLVVAGGAGPTGHHRARRRLRRVVDGRIARRRADSGRAVAHRPPRAGGQGLRQGRAGGDAPRRGVRRARRAVRDDRDGAGDVHGPALVSRSLASFLSLAMHKSLRLRCRCRPSAAEEDGPRR